MPTHYVDLTHLARQSDEAMAAARERVLVLSDSSAYAVLSASRWRVDGKVSLAMTGQISVVEVDADRDVIRAMAIDEVEHCHLGVRFEDGGVYVVELQLDFWDGGATSLILADLPRAGVQTLPQPARMKPYACAVAAVIRTGDVLKFNFEGGFHHFRVRRLRVEKSS